MKGLKGCFYVIWSFYNQYDCFKENVRRNLKNFQIILQKEKSLAHDMFIRYIYIKS